MQNPEFTKGLLALSSKHFTGLLWKHWVQNEEERGDNFQLRFPAKKGWGIQLQW